MDIDVELATLHTQVQPCPVPFEEGKGAASPPSAVAHHLHHNCWVTLQLI